MSPLASCRASVASGSDLSDLAEGRVEVLLRGRALGLRFGAGARARGLSLSLSLLLLVLILLSS